MNQISKQIKIIMFFLLFSAAASEVFILNQNFNLKKQVAGYHHLEIRLPGLESQLLVSRNLRKFESQCLPFVSSGLMNGTTNKNAIIKDSRFIILFCFTSEDCGYCLDGELTTWSDIANSYDPSICQVIGVTDTTQSIGGLKKFLRSREVNFPISQDGNFHSHWSSLFFPVKMKMVTQLISSR